MKDIECPECGAINLVSCWSDDFVCGECESGNRGMSFSELYDMYKLENLKALYLYNENAQLSKELFSKGLDFCSCGKSIVKEGEECNECK